MVNIIQDDFDEGTNGFGSTVDMVSELGGAPGVGAIPIATVTASTSVTAGRAAIQSGVPGANGIVWTSAADSALTPGTAVKLTSPSACQFARVIITAPVIGGACTALLTV